MVGQRWRRRDNRRQWRRRRRKKRRRQVAKGGRGVPVLDLSSVGSTRGGSALKGPCSSGVELSRLPWLTASRSLPSVQTQQDVTGGGGGAGRDGTGGVGRMGVSAGAAGGRVHSHAGGVKVEESASPGKPPTMVEPSPAPQRQTPRCFSSPDRGLWAREACLRSARLNWATPRTTFLSFIQRK